MKRNEVLLSRDELYLYSCTSEAGTSIAGLMQEIIPRMPDPICDESPVFIVGPHACGKSSLARQGLDTAGYQLFDTGPVLRSYHAQDAPGTKFSEWVAIREEEYGDAFTDDLLAGQIIGSLALSTSCRRPVILGNRSLQGVERLATALHASSRRLIYVTAGEAALYERLQNREGRDIRQKKFAKLLRRDIDIGLQTLEEAADFIIHNDGDLDDAVAVLRHAVAT